MAGLYVHIPFCKQACHYCNFHFSTSLRLKDRMIQALVRELELRKDELPDRNLHSVYFGGGTPSLLSERDLNTLFDAIHQHFAVSSDAEITLEANPDDLTDSQVQSLAQTPINRLSIGIQSFHEQELQWMNRAHTATMAHDSIKRAQDAGFSDITIDLMFGLPVSNETLWKSNVKQFLALKLPHLSAYGLTVEPGTALDYRIRNTQSPALSEEAQYAQFQWLMERMEAAGYEHYEISNYALPERYARHNTAYWQGHPYLGIGPSAHSFQGTVRQWNVANNLRYLQSIEAGKPETEREILTDAEQFNDLVLTRLRTQWGINLEEVAQRFGTPARDQLLLEAEPYLRNETIFRLENHLRLSRKGKFVADKVCAALFQV